MRYGLIDVGSNTIRTVVYEVEGKEFRQLLNEKDFSEIISYVKDGRLEDKGAARLIKALGEMAELCRLVSCDEVHCFATASLRGIANASEVTGLVESETGVQIRIISAKEEAQYDFYGLKMCTQEQIGVGLDLGGGSCQIFSYQDGSIAAHASIRTGSLVMYEEFVKSVLPTDKEARAIRHHVKKQLEELPELKSLGYETLYAMGGTARAAVKLLAALTGDARAKTDGVIKLEQMKYLTEMVSDMGPEGVRVISRTAPERFNTILPGLNVIRAVCKFVGADRIMTVKNGVREGYLWKNILKND